MTLLDFLDGVVDTSDVFNVIDALRNKIAGAKGIFKKRSPHRRH